MLRLHDARTGAAHPIRPARRGELATFTVCGPANARPQLRDFLLADLIGRVAALHHLRVSAWHNLPGGDRERFWAACRALNIYPAEFSADPPDPLDVGVGQADPGPAAARGAHWVGVAHALLPDLDLAVAGPASERPDGAPAAAGPVSEDPNGAQAAAASARAAPQTTLSPDPLALRLAMMRTHHRAQLRLSPDDLRAADAELRDWRRQVADWAAFPSKPMCAEWLGQITAAFDDDLDFPAALRWLGELASDEEIPPGSKFESFAHLDQVLGLDLVRDVGR